MLVRPARPVFGHENALVGDSDTHQGQPIPQSVMQ